MAAACAFEPKATAFSAAFASSPIATALAAACAFLPRATAFSPAAFASSPIATEDAPSLTAAGPIATESAPLAIEFAFSDLTLKYLVFSSIFLSKVPAAVVKPEFNVVILSSTPLILLFS